MGHVTASGIWTPGEGEALDPEVYLASMAASIENGMGERLNRQEEAVGLKAGIAAGTRVLFEPGVIAPFEITSGNGNFTQGMTLNGGVATVSVAGMYFITAAAALQMWGGGTAAPENQNRTMALQIKKNGGDIAGCEVRSDELYWQTAQANTVVRCVPGDTIHVNWYSATVSADGSGALVASNPALQSLSIVLVTPVAV